MKTWNLLKNILAAIAVIGLFAFAASELVEAKFVHATKSLGLPLNDTTTAPRWCGDVRMRIGGGDTSYFISNCRSSGRQWFYVQADGYKITDADIIRWNTYTYITNGTGLDTLVYQVNDSTFRIKSIRVVGANGLSTSSSIDNQSILYTTKVAAYWKLSGDSVSTTNATPTTIATFNIASNTSGIMCVDMTGTKSDGSGGITGRKMVRFKKPSGTLTLGTVTSILPDEVDAAVSGATWTITTASNDVIIQVTGVAATNINWRSATTINQK
jgi:hypothetical protein